MKINLDTLITDSATACHEFSIQTYVIEQDVEKILKAIVEVTSLRYGRYDNVSFQSTEGVQRFRSLSGAHMGESAEVVELPVVELTFSIPYDETILKNVIDQIFEANAAEEPVIYIKEIWSTRAIDYSDKTNPNRFWNRTEPKNGKN